MTLSEDDGIILFLREGLELIVNKENIYLIGFMGAGKSTVGTLLSSELSMPFIDLDEKIVERYQCSINQIFHQQGESTFRDYETKMLQELSLLKGHVVSTGGGVIGSDRNWAIMNEFGVVIYLSCSWLMTLERLKGSNGRPLFNDNDLATLKELYDSRLDRYRKADFVIDVDELTPQQVVARIKLMLE
nr:shikimate kinase [uncultured Desulfuromonas sp.]